MSFDADLNACAALVERGDPWRFRGAMAAPAAARRVLFPLYAFNVEVSRAPWVTQEPMIAEMRLQWWRDVCEEIAEGRPVRRHEVATPLARAISAEDARLLDGAVAARRWDVYREAFADRAALDTYLDATAGTLAWVAARRLGEAQEDVVRQAARAAAVAAWLRAIPELEARGRVPLIDGTADGVRHLAQGALDDLRAARARRAKVSKGAGAALRHVAPAAAVLKAAIAEPGRVAEGSLPDPAEVMRTRFALRALSGFW